MAIPPKGHKSPRIAGVNVIRVISLFAIVIGHAYSNELIDRYLQSWRLPIFFMLSGFFFTPRRPLREDVKRRSKSLLIPYLAWGCILVTISVLFLNMDSASLTTQLLLGGSYAQRPLTTFWFLTALFAAALMYRVLSTFNGAIVWAGAVVGLLANMVFGEAMAKVPWSLATATGALFFIQTGNLIAHTHLRVSTKNVQMASVLVLTTCVLTLGLFPGDFEPLQMKQGVFPPFAVAVSVFICGSLISLGTTIKMSERTSRWANYLAMPSLVVIALHPTLLTLFSGRMPYPLVPVSAFSASLAFGIFIIHTPLAKILAGVPGFRDQ